MISFISFPFIRQSHVPRSIPHEIKVGILSHLEPQEILNVRPVSRTWEVAAMDTLRFSKFHFKQQQQFKSVIEHSVFKSVRHACQCIESGFKLGFSEWEALKSFIDQLQLFSSTEEGCCYIHDAFSTGRTAQQIEQGLLFLAGPINNCNDNDFVNAFIVSQRQIDEAVHGLTQWLRYKSNSLLCLRWMLLTQGAPEVVEDPSFTVLRILASPENAESILDSFSAQYDKCFPLPFILHWAASQDRADIIEGIIQHRKKTWDDDTDPNVDVLDVLGVHTTENFAIDDVFHGLSPLWIALRDKCYKAAFALIKCGANIKLLKNYEAFLSRLLRQACSNKAYANMLEFLSEPYLELTEDIKEYISISELLIFAVFDGNVEAVRLLLDRYHLELDWLHPEFNKNTSLHLAIMFDHQEIVSLLLDKGADLYALNGDNYLPLEYVKSKDMIQLIKNHRDFSRGKLAITIFIRLVNNLITAIQASFKLVCQYIQRFMQQFYLLLYVNGSES